MVDNDGCWQKPDICVNITNIEQETNDIDGIVYLFNVLWKKTNMMNNNSKKENTGFTCTTEDGL